MNAFYRIFWYLKCEMSRGNNPNFGRLVYDTRQIEFDDRIFTQFSQYQWNNFNNNDEELLPSKMTKPRYWYVKTRNHVDANHDGNLETRRSHTGIFIYLNNYLIIFFSKRQNT